MSVRPLAVILALLVLTFACAENEAAAQQNERTQAPPDLRAVLEARRSGGIREVARLTRHFVTSDPTFSDTQYDIEDLTRLSNIVVIADAVSDVCRVSADGSNIYTDYQMKVQSVLKGKAPKTLTVSAPGGIVQFDDGTSAEVRTGSFQIMERGQTYVLFLYQYEGEPGVFMLTGRTQGVFSIDAGKITSHGPPSTELAQEYRAGDLNGFTEQVLHAASKWPKREK